jgi:transposase
LHLSERRGVCDACGGIYDRDHNAAVNILREGTQGVPASLGLGDACPRKGKTLFESSRCLTPESHCLPS